MNACFSGGCFWCVTPIYKLYGVDRVICGYSGGDEENPRYQDVKAQRTGHREAILLEYDPEKVNYDRLLDIYFANVDPFDRDGQFIDRGFSYTLAIYYTCEEEKERRRQESGRLNRRAESRSGFRLSLSGIFIRRKKSTRTIT